MADAGRRARAKRTPGKAAPASMRAQLATLVDRVPGNDGWAYELKYDGVRLLCRCDGAKVRCFSRNGIEWTHKVPPIVDALMALRLPGAWIDGELIATDAAGRSDFSLLQHVLEQKRLSELSYCAFDLTWFDGEDLRRQPLARRKATLATAFAKLPAKSPLRLSAQLHGDSAQLLARTCARNLEGLIAKRVDSTYSGTRSPDWLKIKCHREQEFVVGGAAFLPGRGTGTFSSLLVGTKAGSRLKYAGRVGGGLSTDERAAWRARMRKYESKTSPFDRHPDKRAGEIWHWMKPRFVIQVAFQDWTQDGILRQPRYLGLREDKDPASVKREVPAPTEEVVKKKPAARSSKRNQMPTAAIGNVAVGSQKLTHPDRVLYPQDGITKLELAEYFAAIGETAMPHYRNRPLSILRNAHGASPFFQKHFLDASGAGLEVVQIPNADKDPDFVVCDSIEGLLHLAQIGAVELHSWGSVMPRPTHADRLTFDLDPGADLPYPPLRDATLAVRKLLADLGLESWVKTTGGKGLHVVVPLTKPLPDWDAAKAFATAVTKFMERLAPAMFTSKTGERNRKNKIFIDYLRNAFGATAVAAYSPRWRKGVGVSTPVAWDEIDDDIRGDHFNIRNVAARVAKQRKDPWAGYWKRTQSLGKSMLNQLDRKSPR
jgi:bifunctional non-homologous end joining protein LigD